MFTDLFYSLLNMLGQMAPYILLGFFIAGLLHAFVTPDAMSRHLSMPGWKSVVKAAIIGVPLPLCSCGVLPTAIAMRRSGASKAAATSFLIATPQTGVDSIVATYALLGPAFAVIRPIAALVTAMLGGCAVASVETYVPASAAVTGEPAVKKAFIKKITDALRYGFIDLVGSIGKWLVIGLVVAALITVFVPEDFFTSLGNNPLLSMICVLIVAIPMYVCATGSIPIALSLMLKGLSPGTALVLLMAGPAANFASAVLISREMGKKAASIYIASIVVGSVAFGLAIDYLMPREWFVTPEQTIAGTHAMHLSLVQIISAIVLAALLIIAFVRNNHSHKIKFNDMTKEYSIKGMNCSHCQAAVTKAISAVEGVKQVDVNLSTGIALVEGVHEPDSVRKAVEAAGFDVA